MHFVDAKGMLTANKGMNGMNIYRGCTHGCIYCDSRSACYHFTHEFEDTEENITAILEECARIGVKGIICFGMGLTLREGDREYYYEALDRYFPGLKDKYIKTYGDQYELPSPNTESLMKIFTDTCKEHGILYRPEDCFRYMNELPERYEQMSLF